MFGDKFWTPRTDKPGFWARCMCLVLLVGMTVPALVVPIQMITDMQRVQKFLKDHPELKEQLREKLEAQEAEYTEAYA
eukprot:g46694.t1